VRINLVALLLTAVFWSSPAYAVDAGDMAPPWQATNFQGETISFPEVSAGKPAILIFWATWCDYCKAFMPYLKEIQQDYGADRVLIVAVNAKQSDGDPDGYVRQLGFPVTAIRDGDDIADEYDVQFIPGLMVVDGNGIVTYRRGWTELPAGRTVAEFWSGQVREALDKLLD
jgi:thiol-disulfide isomerase/thioredoxin